MEEQSVIMQEGRKKIIIGNTHEALAVCVSLSMFWLFTQQTNLIKTKPIQGQNRNNHKWKFFVMVLDEDQNLGAVPKVPSSYYIEKIEVFLHPTFTPNRIVLTGEPFEIKRVCVCYSSFLLQIGCLFVYFS